MKQFLLVYDRKTGRITDLREYGEGEFRRALRDRFSMEEDVQNGQLEIVVLGASSLDALKRTHARYFKTPKQLVEEATS